MRISILILSTLAATTTAMFFNFAVPATGSRGYAGTIGCAPVSKSKPEQMGNTSNVVPMQWFVDKNMSDNDLSSDHGSLKTAKAVEQVVPAPRLLPELK